jgi:isopentenyldiphosphate isomerase
VPLSDPSELLTRVTDDDSTVLGPVERRWVHGNPSLIHRSAHVLVLHPVEGTLLLQKRSAAKDTYPGRWDTSVGGHVSFGQSYEEAALREAREELGVDLDPASLEYLHLLRFRSAEESENTATFLCLHPGPFTPDPDEISELRFWTRSDIEAALGTDVFTPHFEQEFAAFLVSPRAGLLQGPSSKGSNRRA